MKNVKKVFIGQNGNGEWLITTEQIEGFERATKEDLDNQASASSYLDCSTYLFNDKFKVTEGIVEISARMIDKYDAEVLLKMLC